MLATLHLQDVLGLEPTAAGLVLLPFSASAAAGSVVATAGLTASNGSAAIAAWGVLAGLGIGLASVAATTLGASAVPDAERGTAAGLLNTAARIGTALGIAALVLIAGTASPATGHRLGFAAATAIAALGAVGLALALRPRERPAADTRARHDSSRGWQATGSRWRSSFLGVIHTVRSSRNDGIPSRSSLMPTSTTATPTSSRRPVVTSASSQRELVALSLLLSKGLS